MLVASLFLALFRSVCLTHTLLFSSHFYLYSVLNLFFHVDSAKANITCASDNRGVLLSGRTSLLPQFTSPSSLTISTTQRLLKSSSRSNPATRCPRTCMTRNSTMRPLGKALSSPLFIQEREGPADRRQADHSIEESLLAAQSFFAHSRKGDPYMNLVR